MEVGREELAYGQVGEKGYKPMEMGGKEMDGRDC